MLLFDKLEADVQRKIVVEMYERRINAGDILIQEGDVGLAASELYVVKEGEFEVRLWKHDFPLCAIRFGLACGIRMMLLSHFPCFVTGAGAAAGAEFPREHEGTGRHLRRGVADVQRAAVRHSGRDSRVGGLGPGARPVQVLVEFVMLPTCQTTLPYATAD